MKDDNDIKNELIIARFYNLNYDKMIKYINLKESMNRFDKIHKIGKYKTKTK